MFDSFAGFAGVLLNLAKQFLGLAFGALKLVVRELGALLFQFALDDVKIAFDFEFGHKIVVLSIQSFQRISLTVNGPIELQ
jgi:hypothetical protein